MSPVSPAPSGAFVRGVDSSTGLLTQPRGSVPRASNLILAKRGSLQTCDGSAIVYAFNGVPTAGRGKAMCEFLFAPIAVARYYLRIMKALDVHLGAPQHLTATNTGSDGTLAPGTYYWKVTACDNAAGETTASNEASATLGANEHGALTWNVVPNAVFYNIYRGTASGQEKLIAKTAPAVQPGTLSVTFNDTGYALVSPDTAPPSSDTTQQTGMYKMPDYTQQTIVYDNSNLVALWSADLPVLDGGIGGGGGSGGGTGGGSGGGIGITPSGSYPPGNVSFIPQIVQFVNEACIALGNSYAPQLYRDATGTPDNPAKTAVVSAISVDAYGVVSVTLATDTGLTAANAGACILLAGITVAAYDGCFQTIEITDGTHLKVRNLAAIGSGSSSGGTLTVTTIPFYNTFQPQFPKWVASTGYAVGTAVVPTSGSPADYFVVAAPADNGVSGATEPTWPSTVGATVQDGNITWRNAGPTASAAPAPPGAAHISVYAGALWVWDTYPTNTSNGLDGPCCLRMSDVNNPVSWNPVNTAFLDKDDGTEGYGLAVFTITAQGIPPQGSLIAFKLRGTYQIVGVFGSSNFAIQRVATEMGCLAPRTAGFLPGFGIGRLTHLGIAVFDGVNDRLISPQVNPYLFPTNDPELDDITVADAQWLPCAMGVLTADPPMYCVFIPIGDSGGALTRGLCYDLILRAWVIVDLPFPISATLQAYGVTSTPITMLGSFSDGTMQRWQAGDVQWAVANGDGGTAVPTQIAYSMRGPVVASKSPDERLYGRRYWVRGYTGVIQPSPMLINPRANGVALGAQPSYVPLSGQFMAQAAINETSDWFDAFVYGTGPVTIDACGAHVTPKPLGVLQGELV